jgi:hypothetical protein
MRRLYDIDEDIKRVLEEYIDEETGEIKEGFDEAYEKLGRERDAKIEGVGLMLKETSAFLKAAKAEKAALDKKIKSAETEVESLKTYLTLALNGEKFKTDRVSMYYSKSKHIEIAENAQIPMKYLTIAEPTPNRTALREAIESGEKIKGVSIEETPYIVVR